MIDLKADYAYLKTRILKNNDNSIDQVKLKQLERGITAIRIQALREHPVHGNYDLAHLQTIHHHIFKDIYNWAGVCIVDIAEDSGSERALLTSRETLLSQSTKITAMIKEENYLRGIDKIQFVHKLVEIYAALCELNPFRKGNELAIREFIWQLAKTSGYDIDYSKVSKEVWDNAGRALTSRNLTPMHEVFHIITTVIRAVAFEKLPCRKALAQHPELDGAYKMLIDAQRVGQHTAFLHAEILKELKTGCLVGDGVSIEESHHIIQYSGTYLGLKVIDADHLHQAYRGNVIAISSFHILLKVNDSLAICYERRKLDHTVHVGDRITITPSNNGKHRVSNRSQDIDENFEHNTITHAYIPKNISLFTYRGEFYQESLF